MDTPARRQTSDDERRLSREEAKALVRSQLEGAPLMQSLFAERRAAAVVEDEAG
jgi:hypothetical protein